MIRNLNLVFEELTSGLLILRPGTLSIHIEIEYSNVDEIAKVTITFEGEAYDPLKDEGALGASIIRGICTETRYCFDGKNCLELILD